jgi:hypothetical protein
MKREGASQHVVVTQGFVPDNQFRAWLPWLLLLRVRCDVALEGLRGSTRAQEKRLRERR